MSRDRSVRIHPACCALPALPEKAFTDLCASIKAIGLQQPILVDADDAVLDGKNRFWACEKVGVAPRFQKVVITGDPVRWVFELNRHRLRKNGQLALAGARLATAEDGRPNETGPFGPVSPMTNDEVAKALAISARAIKRAKFIIEHGVDELVEYLERGEITLGCAEWAAKATREEQTLACAADVKAVRELAAAQRLAADPDDEPLLVVQVTKRITDAVLRWPKDEPCGELIACLETHIENLKRRMAA